MYYVYNLLWASLVDSDGKESACNSGDPGSILGLGRSPGEGNGNPLQYFYLENSMDREVWKANSPRGCKEMDTTERLTHKNGSGSIIPRHY